MKSKIIKTRDSHEVLGDCPSQPPCWEDKDTWRNWCWETAYLFRIKDLRCYETLEEALDSYCDGCTASFEKSMHKASKCRKHKEQA